MIAEDGTSTRRLPLALAYAPFALGCAAIFAVSAMSDPPLPEALVFRWSDKLLHAVAYAGLAGLALWGARARRGGEIDRGARLVAVALATAYGVLDEVHQSFVPNRSPSVSDAVADFVGACLGVLVAGALLRRSSAEAPRRG